MMRARPGSGAHSRQLRRRRARVCRRVRRWVLWPREARSSPGRDRRHCWRLPGSLRVASTAVPGAVGKGWDGGRNARLPARATAGRRRFWFSAQQVLTRAGRGRCRVRAAARRSRKVAMSGLKARLTDAGYGLGWSVVCRLPESWAQSVFRFFAGLAWRRGRGVQVLEGNLRRVIGSQAPGGRCGPHTRGRCARMRATGSRYSGCR